MPSSEKNYSTNSKRESEAEREERIKRRKCRRGNDETEKSFTLGIPTVPPTNLSKDQEEAYPLQLQIEEVSRKLRTGDLGIPANPEERPPIIQLNDKVMIPQDDYPDINFIGLLIGPRGNTLKSMEMDTGAKITIRGKGSVKEGNVGRKDGQPRPGGDEPLHVYVTANNPECVEKAVNKIKEIIRQAVEVPEGQNDLKIMQLRALAFLCSALAENDGPRCTNCKSSEHNSWMCSDVTNNIVCSACGGVGHITIDCRQNLQGENVVPATRQEQAIIDQEYMSLMAELEDPPPPVKRSSGDNSLGSNSFFTSRPTGVLFDHKLTWRATYSYTTAPPPTLTTPPQLIPNTLPPPPLLTQALPTPPYLFPNTLPPPPWNYQHLPITPQVRMDLVANLSEPPPEHMPPTIQVNDKVMIPQDDHPEINFIGLLIGPRGNTLKSMERDTGAKISIRGKGSVKRSKVGRKDGQPRPGEDEPLHANVTANNLECVKKAVDKIKEIIRQVIEVPEGQNGLKRMQLRELALLNGTFRENVGPHTNCGSSEHKSWMCPDEHNVANNIVCSSCGGSGHIAKDCRQKRPRDKVVPATRQEQAKIDQEPLYLSKERYIKTYMF